MAKKRWGDRKDGALLRDIDAMHFIMPLIYPNRCDNEAYISEDFDLTNINAFLARKNLTETDFPYTLFHIIVVSIVKAITLRPKLNRFIANQNLYQRNDVSASFIVKKKFSDEGGEGLAILRAKPEDTLTTLHEKLFKQISANRSEHAESSTEDSMNIINKLPRFISKAAVRFICFLDRHGKCPDFLISSDPYYASAILSNLGSLKLKCGYHHLTNWGTTSLFCVVGEKKIKPVFQPDGSYEMHETVPLGLTIDERLADGYYYAKTVRLLKKLMENPELLEKPLSEDVDY